MALTKATYSMISGAVVNVFDYMTQAEIDDVSSNTASIDVTAKIQAAIDSSASGVQVFLPKGIYKTTAPILLGRNDVHIVGAGFGTSIIKFVNAAGGIVFSGDEDLYDSMHTYSGCSIENLEVYSSGVTSTDASIVIDLTSFSYGYFNIRAQTKRPYGVIYYGQGNAGTSPYYNQIESTGLFGGPDYTQTCFKFAGGAWTGGSNGPNANMIGPITRMAAFATAIDLQVGQGNMFSQIGAETIIGNFVILGHNNIVDSGTSSGTNTTGTLNDTTKTWTSNQFAGGSIQITGGTGSGQVRHISSNTGTQIVVSQAWATVPNATSTYQLYYAKCSGNKFINIRNEGSVSSTFCYAWPDSRGTEIDHATVQSTGGYLTDKSCSPSNKFYGQSRSVINHQFVTPGASANINAFVKSSVFGGVKFAGDYVIDWVYAEVTSTSHGDTASITVDCGGTTVGGGSPTFGITIPDGSSAGCAIPFGDRVGKSGENNGIFLNLQTGGSFSALVSVSVTIGFTLIGE